MSLTQNQANIYLADSTPPGAGSQKWNANFEEVSKYRMPCIDARHFGVTADGSTDDTDDLTSALEEASDQREGFGLILPVGSIKISDTLPAELMSGLRVFGAGSPITLSVNGSQNDRTTRIVASSSSAFASKPMISLLRTHSTLLDGFALIGNPDSSTPAAESGIEVASVDGFGSAALMTRGMGFFRCVRGIRMGDGTQFSNDSETLHLQPTFRECTHGWYGSHSQSVNHVFVQPNFNTVTNCFRLASDHPSTASKASPGHLLIQNAVTYAVDRFIYAANGNSQGGRSFVHGLRMDGPVPGHNRPVVFEMESTTLGGKSRWTFSGIEDKAVRASGGARFILYYGCHIRITDSQLLCGADGPLVKLIGVTDNRAFVEITGCDLPDNLDQIIDPTSIAPRYNIHNNHDGGVNHTGTTGTGWRQ